MSRKIPRGPEDLVCPLHKKSMELVCHKCPLWVQVRGKNPQNGEEIDDWNCAVAWLPVMLIENAHQSRKTSAAVETFRNAMVAQNSVLGVIYKPDVPQLEKQEQGMLTDERD
jgi:hypothetical protein